MKQAKSFLIETFDMLFAVLLASIGLKAFLLPNGFLDGGVTGVSILISEFFSINLSYVLPIATIPFFIIGWFTVSKRILVKSIISVLLLAVFIEMENFQSITDDKLIISIFGGLFLGAGIGHALKNGTVLDGSELLGIFVNEKFGFSIGNIILAFNVVLFAVTAFVLTIDTALYSTLTYIVTAKVIDFMIRGFEDYVGLMIVTEKPLDVEKKLFEEIGLGMTVYGSAKGYGNQGKRDNLEVIHTVLNRIDTRRAYKTIESVDEKAFIIEFDVNHIKGGVFRRYLGKNKNNPFQP